MSAASICGRSGRAVALAGLLLAAICAMPAMAQVPIGSGTPSGATPGQNTGIIAPKLPQAPPPAIVAPPSAPLSGTPGPALAQAGAILGQLKGLAFVAGSQALNADGLSVESLGPNAIYAPQLPLLNDPKFVAQMKPHLGKSFKLGDLQQIRDETKAWYVAHQRPFVDIVVPPQNINSGVIQVVVSEYRLGEVEVVGARYSTKSLIKRPVDLKKGQTIGLAQLQDNIDRLNENPFVSIDAEFKPGKDTGSTDLVLRAKDRLPVRVYAGYDNQGVPTLDELEWNAGVNWGNVFGTGQIASYQYTKAFNGRFASHSVSDVITIDNTDKLLVFGNFATMRSTSFLGPFEFDANGHAAQASIRWVHTVPKIWGVSGNVQVGYDYKFTDNNALFDQIQLGPPSAMETHQFLLVYDGNEVDKFGSTAIENDLVAAPGNITARDTDAAMQSLVAGARARYVYDRLSITRTTRLPFDISFIARGIFERASGILPNSEQLGGGGVGSVRGYFPDTGLGSNGQLLSAELRLPAFSVGRFLPWTRRIGDLAQAGLFYDYANLSQPYYPQDLLAPSAASGTIPLDMASTGFLIHYSVSRFIDLNFDMGWQLRTTPDQQTLGSFGAVAVVFSN